MPSGGLRGVFTDGAPWAQYRAHGDPYPLKPQWVSSCTEEAEVSFPQRGLWAARSLNSLALHDTNSDFDHILRGLPPTSAQVLCKDRIIEALREAGPCPHDLDGPVALAEIGGSKFLYSEMPQNLATYSAEKVKVLQSNLQPKPLVKMLPPNAAALLHRAETFVEKSCKEVAMEGDSGIVPYWDPVLKHSPKELKQLMVKLANRGLVTFRTSIRERIGIFFVKKKTPEFIRMVIDARRANFRHKAPPTTRLATPRSYLEMQLDAGSTDNPAAFGMEADVADCFYNFFHEDTASWFGVDFPLTAGQWWDLGWNGSKIFDEGSKQYVGVDRQTVLFPVFRGLCMGWSWALYFANEAVNHIVNGFSISRSEVRDQKPFPSFSEQALTGVYVDNISIIGKTKDQVKSAASKIERAFAELNIPLTWSSDEPQDTFTTVGIVLDFRQRKVLVKPRRLWKVFLAGREILRRGRVSGSVLEKWLGHMTFIFMVAPAGLSTFFHIYRQVQQSRGRRVQLWSSVRREIRTALGIMWLSKASIAFDPVLQVDAGDSSSDGYALMTTWAQPSEIREALRWKEAWRFRPIPEDIKTAAQNGDRAEILRLLDALEDEEQFDESQEQTSSSSFGAGLRTQYADWLLGSLDDSSWLRTSSIRSQMKAAPSRRVQVDVPALVRPLSAELCEPARFKLLWRKRWIGGGDKHINVKEGHVALSSLRRTCRVQALHHKTKLTLTDNLACLCAFERGRSSSFPLNRLCRQAAAYQYGSGVRWRLRHLETKRNPADRDSRFWQKSGRNSGNRGAVFHRPAAHGVEVDRHSFEAGRTPSQSSSAPKPKKHVPGFFLEIFSGTSRLTAAVQTCGMATAPPVDISFGSHHDLRRRSTQLAILSWLKAGWIRVVHMGTPCTVFSRARHAIRNTQRATDKEKMGIEFALFTAEVISVCNRYNIKWSLENPRSSRLFEVPILEDLLCCPSVFTVHLDFCQYGEPYKKPTKIVGNYEGLLCLAAKCNHKNHTVILRGSETIEQNGKHVSVPKTQRAGAYPWLLVEKWAQVIVPYAVAESRDSNLLFSQMCHDLITAAKEKADRRQQIQTLSQSGPHTAEIEKQIGSIEKVIVFGQHTNKQAEARRKAWEKASRVINWAKYKSRFHP